MNRYFLFREIRTILFVRFLFLLMMCRPAQINVGRVMYLHEHEDDRIDCRAGVEKKSKMLCRNPAR